MSTQPLKKILLVDDDKDVREIAKAALADDETLIMEAGSGTRLLEIVRAHKVDLVLLDLTLPDGDGLDFLEILRHHTSAPVIILSGKIAITDKTKSFDKGVDDYIGKPFDPLELRARIGASLRRYKRQGINPQDSIHPHAIKFGDWTLDRRNYQIFGQDGKSGNLTIHEFHLLEALIMAQGRSLHREDLLSALDETGGVEPRMIDVRVTRIRKKIGDLADAPAIIKTVRGVGYALGCSVKILD